LRNDVVALHDRNNCTLLDGGRTFETEVVGSAMF